MWYGLFLGSGVTALQPTLKIQQSFLVEFAVAGQSDDMAIFSKSGGTEAGTHEVTLYFSPAAAAFAKTIPGAAPCTKPPSDGLSLLVGNSPGAFHVLFPEWQPRQR